MEVTKTYVVYYGGFYTMMFETENGFFVKQPCAPILERLGQKTVDHLLNQYK